MVLRIDFSAVEEERGYDGWMAGGGCFVECGSTEAVARVDGDVGIDEGGDDGEVAETGCHVERGLVGAAAKVGAAAAEEEAVEGVVAGSGQLDRSIAVCVAEGRVGAGGEEEGGDGDAADTGGVVQWCHSLVGESVDGRAVAEEQSDGGEVVLPTCVVQGRPSTEVVHRGVDAEGEEGSEDSMISSTGSVVQWRGESICVLDDEVAALEHDLVNGFLDAVFYGGYANYREMGVVFAGKQALGSGDEEMHENSVTVRSSIQERGLATARTQSMAIENRCKKLRKTAVHAGEGGKVTEGELLTNEHDEIEGQREAGFRSHGRWW